MCARCPRWRSPTSATIVFVYGFPFPTNLLLLELGALGGDEALYLVDACLACAQLELGLARLLGRVGKLPGVLGLIALELRDALRRRTCACTQNNPWGRSTLQRVIFCGVSPASCTLGEPAPHGRGGNIANAKSCHFIVHNSCHTRQACAAIGERRPPNWVASYPLDRSEWVTTRPCLHSGGRCTQGSFRSLG